MKLKPGILTGNALRDVFAHLKEVKAAIPAVNVIGSNTISAALQAAKEAKSPIVIQFSNGGAQFNAGKHLDNTNQKACIIGAVAGAYHVRRLALAYGVSVILHTDHAAKKLLPWIDGIMLENEAYFNQNGQPLFSSHMLDLSEEGLKENLDISARYLERMSKVDMCLEIELGVTGGEEDGVDNSHLSADKLYTKPEDVLEAYDRLNPLGHFTVAASFGNTHGVYAPGNVKLTPSILRDSQALVVKSRSLSSQKPLDLVFHGGSGSEKDKIDEAVSYGVVKFNIDTDTQWAFTKPIKDYMDKNSAYLQSQIGNPEGPQKPNKKQIDPRAWLIKGEDGMKDRLIEAFKDLNSFEKFQF